MSWERKISNTLLRFLRSERRALFLAKWLGKALVFTAPRKDVALVNMRIVFPEMPEAERLEMLRRNYEHLALLGVEALCLQNDPAQVLGWFESIEGGERFDEARSAGKGLILLHAHLGNWELTAAWFAQKGYPIGAVVQHSKKKGQRELIQSMRERVGLRVFDKFSSMKAGVMFLREGGFLGLLPDQHGAPQSPEYLLWGKKTKTFEGPGAFAWFAECPVLPVYSWRVAPFRHRMRVLPPLEVDRSLGRDGFIRAMTQACNGAIEKMVEAVPDQWLWLHRRFRGDY